MMQELFPDVQVDVIAEEGGCEIYLNTNPDIFPDRWYVYIEDDDDYYFQSDEELIKFFKEKYNMDLTDEYDLTNEYDICIDDCIQIHRFLEN